MGESPRGGGRGSARRNARNKTLSLQDVRVQARQQKALLPVTIRLANEDIATARQLADNQGVGYQTYIKLLLHEALQKAARLVARPAGQEVDHKAKRPDQGRKVKPQPVRLRPYS